MHTHTCTHTHTHTHAHTHAHTYAHTHMHTRTQSTQSTQSTCKRTSLCFNEATLLQSVVFAMRYIRASVDLLSHFRVFAPRCAACQIPQPVSASAVVGGGNLVGSGHETRRGEEEMRGWTDWQTV